MAQHLGNGQRLSLDEALAYKLQKKEVKVEMKILKAKSYHETDVAYARLLQENETKERKSDLEKEQLSMTETVLGKSILMVERIFQEIATFKNSNSTLDSAKIQPVAKDDMVCLMERMLMKQATYIALGYSYFA